MKSIIFMRHSFAEVGYDKTDFERSITEDGFIRIEEQAKIFKNKTIKIDFVLSSSATRTQETTRYFLNRIKQTPKIDFENWIYEDYTTSDFIQSLKNISEEAETILFVGHNPSISMMACQMSKEGLFNFQPASILKFDFDIPSWDKIEARSGVYDFYLK